MSLLIATNLKKLYAAQEVLRGATFQIDPGQKVGLVGRNGGGKTTLLRIIEGLEAPDGGSLTIAKGARVGHVPQRPEFAPGVTVRGYVESGLDELTQTIAALEAVNERMGEVDGDELERALKEHDRLSERIEVLGGWETNRRSETVMSGIGLHPSLWEREARTLSGGEKSRTALARELVAGHDLLLLDEPTNHLDLDGIEWIEAYLKELRGAVLIVSHDRRLLSNSVDAILELEFGELRRYPGNYERYLTLRDEWFQAELRAWEQERDFVRKEEAFIKKHMGSQRTGEAKGRLKRLKSRERLEQPRNDVRRPVIRAPEAARGGELVLEIEALAGGYGEKRLFENVELRVGRGERIGIVGRNGIGKSTLLKILAGRRKPLAGRVIEGHKAVCGYYDQETGEFLPDGTPFSEVQREHPQMTEQEIRDHLARFLFRGDDVDKSVGSLSGGERARLALAKLVLTEPTWLAMDEPTNHLDLAGRTALEEMLGEFQGALLVISHDRAFLDGLCNRIVVVDASGVTSFRGNYSAWRRHVEAQAERADEARRRKEKEAREAERARREKAAKKSRKAAPPKPGGRKPKAKNPYLFKKLEDRIIALEEELEARRAELATEDVYLNPDRLKDVQFRLAEIESELGEANARWEEWAS